MQPVVPGVTREDGLHAAELKVATGVTTTLLPVPLIGMAPPAAEAPMVLVRPTFTMLALGANVRFAVATTPSAIAVAFRPVATHV
ncbi:MAG: hypothetical protein LAP87_00740 [Acidobacteriia bacterium]|nr:hypothetical protein [Terriglobia bacterium]